MQPAGSLLTISLRRTHTRPTSHSLCGLFQLGKVAVVMSNWKADAGAFVVTHGPGWGCLKESLHSSRHQNCVRTSRAWIISSHCVDFYFAR